jgi:hypothetical protein
MLTGTVNDSDEPSGPTHVFPTEPGWKPIVNTDIKDTNVVLGHAAGNYYASYKTPRMIDFGLAFDNGKFSNRAAKRTELDQWATNRTTIGWRSPISSTKALSNFALLMCYNRKRIIHPVKNSKTKRSIAAPIYGKSAS